MCGIVGYTGPRAAEPLLLSGLEKLEYRGYDSAGISLLAEGRLSAVRSVGNLGALRQAVDVAGRSSVEGDGGVAMASLATATTGIGHTRWATHGRVTEENAHPHFDSQDRVHIVLNGIVENYVSLRDRLRAEGAVFTSETDAEVVAHLIASHFDGDLAEAVRIAYNELRGHYAFAAVCADAPDLIVGARKECPLIVGRGEGEQFLASAIPAFLSETRNVQFIENDEIVEVTPRGVRFMTCEGTPIEREVIEIDWDEEAAEKGGYETFMLKEIHEQADALAETLADRLQRDDGVDLGDLGVIDDEFLRDVRRVVVVACGTSYHAGLVGRYAIEEWARVPVEMDIASEYRYRNPVIDEHCLVIGISQSGETADTLAAMRLAREQGGRVLAVTNVMGSQATRDSDGVLYTRAGLEVGVAATKTFVTQVAAMYLLALRLAELRGTLDAGKLRHLVAALRRIPSDVDELVGSSEPTVHALANRYAGSDFFMYIGRHVGVPVALEGALKLKEIAYIATDAYAAGEMKHGPIALLDVRTPVVAIATDGPVLEKVVSNIQEVRARGAHVLAIATAGNASIAEHAEDVVAVPRTDPMLQALLAVIPLQLLAYYIARRRGLNVDQPRNLAKTVTVE